MFLFVIKKTFTASEYYLLRIHCQVQGTFGFLQ